MYIRLCHHTITARKHCDIYTVMYLYTYARFFHVLASLHVPIPLNIVFQDHKKSMILRTKKSNVKYTVKQVFQT